MSLKPPDSASELPRRLQKLAIDPRRGLPIPWFADPRALGGDAVHFNLVERETVLTLAERRWCYVCGDPIPLTEDAWFLGDEQSYLQRYYPETIGHRECLAASLVLCPYIRTKMYSRATERRIGQPRLLEDDQKPVVWVLAGSRYYKVVRSGRKGFYPKALRGARYFGYDDSGDLEEVNLDQANRLLFEAGMDMLRSSS